MALGIISGALGIAKLIPDVIDLFDGKDNKSKAEVAKDVVDLGSRAVAAATGKTYRDPEEIQRQLEASSEAQAQLQKLYATHKHDLEVKYLQDVADAREMYEQTNNPTTNALAKNVMRYNIFFVLIAVGIQVVCMFYLQERANLLALIANLVGIVVGNLLQERTKVLSFYFGSSLGSKAKDSIKSAFTKSVKK
jgi:hypothetical protein